MLPHELGFFNTLPAFEEIKFFFKIFFAFSSPKTLDLDTISGFVFELSYIHLNASSLIISKNWSCSRYYECNLWNRQSKLQELYDFLINRHSVRLVYYGMETASFTGTNMRYFTQATTSLNRQSRLHELYDFLINRHSVRLVYYGMETASFTGTNIWDTLLKLQTH